MDGTVSLVGFGTETVAQVFNTLISSVYLEHQKDSWEASLKAKLSGTQSPLSCLDKNLPKLIL